MCSFLFWWWIIVEPLIEPSRVEVTKKVTPNLQTADRHGSTFHPLPLGTRNSSQVSEYITKFQVYRSMVGGIPDRLNFFLEPPCPATERRTAYTV